MGELNDREFVSQFLEEQKKKIIKQYDIILKILNSPNPFIIDLSRGFIEIISSARKKINEFKEEWNK